VVVALKRGDTGGDQKVQEVVDDEVEVEEILGDNIRESFSAWQEEDVKSTIEYV
jgi:hypothetical protein